MSASRLSLALTALLLLGSGGLLLLLGNMIPILVAVVLLLLSLMFRRLGGAASAWLSTIGGIGIFLAGTPLTGSPPEGLLISAVMALYFICWVQLLKGGTMSVFAPTGPFTLMFYGSILLVYLLLRSSLFPLPQVITIVMASAFILVSLALWEMGRRSRLSQAGQVENPSAPDWISRVVVLLTIFLTTFLLFRLPIPWLANGALDVASSLNLTMDPPSWQGKERTRANDRQGWRDTQQEGQERDSASGEGDPSDGDTPGGSPWRRGTLPQQADVQLSEVARFHLQLLDPVEAQRLAGRPLYMRAHTLSVFDGKQWTRAPYEGTWIEDRADGQVDGWVTFHQVPAARVIQQRVYLYHQLVGGALIGMPNVIAYKGDAVFRQGDDFLSDRQFGDVVYDIVSAPLFYDEVVGDQVLEPGEAPAHCLERAQGVTFRDMENYLLRELLANDPSVKQKLAYVRQWFQGNYTYSTTIENPDGLDPLANFLFHEKRGYCDFFAQAGAHMLRALELPSRVAYGYAGGVYDPKQDLYTFREADAHAWTEVFLRNHGWVILDLVPAGSGPAQAPVTQATGTQEGNPLSRFLRSEEEEIAEEAPTRDRDLFPEWDWEAWLENLWIIQHLDIVLGVAIAGLLLSYLIRRWRQRRTRTDSEAVGLAAAAREPPGYFRDLCELLADLHRPRSPGETLRESLERLKHDRIITNEFDPIEAYHYGVEYENASRSRSQEKAFRQHIRRFRAEQRSVDSVDSV